MIVEQDNYMLLQLLDLKASYWGLDSDEYIEWKEYFEALNERELRMEYNDHFGDYDD